MIKTSKSEAMTEETAESERARKKAGTKRTRATDITQTLRQQILDGALAPGTHLYEEALATRFASSRTPIRAALVALAQENLLVYSPNRGYQVPRFSIDDILKAYDMRGTLEGFAAREAAERGLSHRTERQIVACLGVVDSILEKGKLVQSDQSAWREMNVLFHGALREEVDNRFLTEMLGTMQTVPLLSNAMVQWYDFETVSRYHEHHHHIFDAVRKRQGARAEHLMREHIYQARELVRRSVAARDEQPSLKILGKDEGPDRPGGAD